MLIAIANEQRIDLEAAFERVLEKYRVRDANRWRRKEDGGEPAAPGSDPARGS